MEAQGYPPHLTLVICDGAAPVDLADTLRQAFAGAAPYRITFDAVRRFPTAPHVLWLHPRERPQLRDLHATAYSLIASEQCDPHYRPDRWEAHCTLATGVLPERDADARRLLSEPFAPVEVFFDQIELVSLPSVQAVCSVTLTASGPRR